MARTDIHAPSAFNPDDYRVIGYIDNKRPDPPITGDAQMLAAYERFIRSWEAQVFEHFPDWRTGGTDHRSIFQCNHCGHPGIRYVAVVEHIPTGARLAFGETCAERCDLAGRDAFQARFIFDAAKRKLAAYEKEAKRLAFYTEHKPVCDWLSTEGTKPDAHPFVNSMWLSLYNYGELTDKQLAASEKWMARETEYRARIAQRKAEEAASLANVAPLAEGRYTVEGIIISTKVVHGDYGSQLKMLVKMDDGNKVWGTVPQSIVDAANGLDDDGMWSGTTQTLKGMRVAFTAKVQRSSNDQHFGFYSRPTQGRKVA